MSWRTGLENSRRRLFRSHAAVLAIAVFALVLAVPGTAPAALHESGAGPMTALFQRASYAQGQTARLTLDADVSSITVEPIASLPWQGQRQPWVPATSVADDTRVGMSRTLAWHHGARVVSVSIGNWPSGVYFVRIGSSAGTVVAPLVVRPRHLGEAHVLVVVPTYSWQAYNARDGDTWYYSPAVSTAYLNRPYMDHGVPFNFGQYDRAFFAWMTANDAQADVISDQDYNAIESGWELRHLYRMIIFEGHAEYATNHMFDITRQYRNLGGHLAFLSANDFYREVTVNGEAMTLIGLRRNLGTPEAELMGAQYIDWSHGEYPYRTYVVTGARKLPWLFAGTGLKDGDLIKGWFGIEIDARVPSSPPGTTVVASIPDIFRGETAQMTYYTTAAGAEVFDAGTINFGGAAHQAQVGQMLANLWLHMTGSAVTSAAACPPS